MVGFTSVNPVKCQIKWGRGTAGLKVGPSVQESFCQNALLPSVHTHTHTHTDINMFPEVVMVGAFAKLRKTTV